MGLVDYSDSESSDAEAPAAPKTALAKPGNNKPAFQKVIDRSNPGKIKVGLPAAQSEPEGKDGEVGEPPAKRRKRSGSGAFAGFAGMLPAPKRAGGQAKSAPQQPRRTGGLKTSSEAGFGVAPVRPHDEEGYINGEEFSVTVRKPAVDEAPVKLEGNSTSSRFRPMSMANKNKKPKKPIIPSGDEAFGVKQAKQMVQEKQTQAVTPAPEPVAELVPKPKPKRSLFGAPQDEEEPADASMTTTTSTTYEPILSESAPAQDVEADPTLIAPAPALQQPDPTSLTSTADDLNLTPAERRQLFGKHGAAGNFHVSHFNTSDEYANNEKLRQAGEVTQHRAVKAVAPGKHSLQQLVNNAKTQQEGLEDAWAAGRSKRAEGAGRYGWGR